MSESEHEHDSFLEYLEQCGYRDARRLSGGRYAAIARMMFTYAILVGKWGDKFGYDDRWCYHDYTLASVALNEWNGIGEPRGWHRHPKSGRRRTDSDPAREYVNF